MFLMYIRVPKVHVTHVSNSVAFSIGIYNFCEKENICKYTIGISHIDSYLITIQFCYFNCLANKKECCSNCYY